MPAAVPAAVLPAVPTSVTAADSDPARPVRPGAAAADSGERAGTLARGLALLECLAAAAAPMNLAELAAAAHLDQSTAHRLVRALEDAGYVVRHEASKRYSPSPKLLHPLPLMHPLEQVRREAAPLLRELAQQLQLTTLLVLFVGVERLVLDIVQVPGSLTPYYGSWLRGPLHATGGGKSLLLGLDAAQRRALLGPEPWTAATPHTLTGWAALDADLRLAAERGYIVSRNEHRLGVTNVGAPIRRWTGGAAGCLLATARSQDLDDAACARIGGELRRVAELLVFQAPSLESASRFCGL